MAESKSPSASSAPKITHCIFDMDGLLLDTESFYTQVQRRILAKYNREFTWDLKAKMMGLKALESAALAIRELHLEGQLTAEDFLAQREQELDALFPTAQLLPERKRKSGRSVQVYSSSGAARLVRHLHAHSIPICVSTSSHSRHFQMKTTLHRELFSLFDHIITGDQVARGKPAPDPFLTAAGKYDPVPTPEQCLVFEDAPAGVKAGLAAGMSVVMVPDRQLDRAATTEAHLVLSSLLEFDPVAWGLPVYPPEHSPTQL